MNRALLLVVVGLACSPKEERARQATDFRQTRDALLTAEVVKAAQSSASVGRLIYERPADLSYDSLRVKRPDLVSSKDRPPR